MSSQKIVPRESTNAKLKVGLLLDSHLVSKYVYELAEWVQTQDNLLITHLVIQEAQHERQGEVETAIATSKNKEFLNSIRLRMLALITKFENFRLEKVEHHKNHLERFDLKKIVPDSISITPIASPESVDRYPVEDVQKVRDLGLDLLIRCGSGILHGELSKASQFGLISFDCADNRKNKNTPPGFWEVYLKQDNTGFIIRQWTEDLDGGKVLISGHSPTKSFFLLNQAALYTRTSLYLRRLLNSIATARALPPALDSEHHSAPLSRIPNLLEQLKYFSQELLSTSLNAINRLLLKRGHRFGVAHMNGDWKTLVMSRANKIRNPPYHYLADPFAISEGSRDYCFVEDYDYRSSRGCISVYELIGKNAARLGEAIVEPFHMSFPYLFRFDSKIYMCPETSENMEIRLYECVNFPLEWKLVKILMSHVSAVDTMIFEHDGLWWLFTNIDPTNTDSHESELSIFYSDNPLTGDWHPHPQNPAVIDSAKGRNAGLLFDEKWIYRVAQKQGIGLYGKGFSINKIIALNQVEYAETELSSVEPKFFPKLLGCHHLHSNGNISVFDYLRLIRINC